MCAPIASRKQDATLGILVGHFGPTSFEHVSCQNLG